MRDARPEGSPYPKADLTLRGLARLFDLALAFAVANAAGPIGPVLACVYLLTADGLLHGQSLGKRIFGVRAMVLQRGATRGRPAGYRESMLRNLPFALLGLFYGLTIIGWLMLFLAGVPILAFESWMVWSDRLGIRIGDIFADTQVVDAKVVSKVEVTVSPDLRAVSPQGPGPAAAHRGARAAA
jgi:uncharacterized RDD family membrane protein YckC